MALPRTTRIAPAATPPAPPVPEAAPYPWHTGRSRPPACPSTSLASALFSLLTCLSRVPSVCRAVCVLMTCKMGRQLCTTLPPVIGRSSHSRVRPTDCAISLIQSPRCCQLRAGNCQPHRSPIFSAMGGSGTAASLPVFPCA